jgi:hypothetical protein
MTVSEKIIEYQKLQRKAKECLSILEVNIGKVKANKDKSTNLSELPTNVLKDNLEKLNNMQIHINELNDIHKKTKKIICSLNKDEKKEFEQLGLLNDDES